MYFQGLLLANFRGYADQMLKFGRYNQIRGENGSGKSTVLYGLTWAMLGECRITQKKGRNSDHLIREDQPEANVAVQFDGIAVQRSLPRKGSGALLLSTSESTKIADNQPRILDAIGANAETVLALLDPTPFLQRSEEEQYSILLRVLRPPKITVSDLLKKWGVPQINGVQHLDELLKRFKDLNLRDANREQKQLSAIPISKPDWPRPGLKEDDITKGYKQACALREKLTGEHGGLAAELKIREADLAAPEMTFELLSPHMVTALEGDITTLRDQLATLAEEQRTVNAKKVELSRQIGEITTAKQEQASRSAVLKGELAGMAVPIECSADACPVIAEYTKRFSETRKKAEKELKLAEKKFLEASKEALNLQEEFDAVEAQLKEIHTAEIDLLPKKTATERRLSRHEIQSQAKAQYEAQRPNKEQLAVDVAALQEKLADCAQRLSVAKMVETKGQQALAAVAEYNLGVQKAEDHARKILANMDKIKDIKQVIRELETRKQDIVESRIAKFAELMNQFLEPFAMKVTYSLDEGFRINNRPLEMFSHSQMAMFFEAAFRFAVAKITELGVIVLEHEAPTDAKHHTALVRQLLKSECQVFQVFATDEQKNPPAMPGVKFFWCSLDPVGISHAVEILAEAA